MWDLLALQDVKGWWRRVRQLQNVFDEEEVVDVVEVILEFERYHEVRSLVMWCSSLLGRLPFLLLNGFGSH